MTPLSKSGRASLYHFYGFGGTTDWAINLASYEGDNFYDDPDDIGVDPLPPCDGNYGSLDDVTRDTDAIPNYCMPGYIMDALAAELDKGISDYNAISESYVSFLPCDSPPILIAMFVSAEAITICSRRHLERKGIWLTLSSI
jgi:hypothetical protein